MLVYEKNARDFYHDRKNDLKTQEQVTKALKPGDLLLFQDFFNSPFLFAMVEVIATAYMNLAVFSFTPGPIVEESVTLLRY